MGEEWMQVFKERADGALLGICDPPYQRSEPSIANNHLRQKLIRYTRQVHNQDATKCKG